MLQCSSWPSYVWLVKCPEFGGCNRTVVNVALFWKRRTIDTSTSVNRYIYESDGGGAINKMEKLPDDNWSYWRKVIYAIHKKEKVWDIVIGNKIAPTGADASDSATEEFVAKQEKACGWLVRTISSKLSYLIPNEPDDPAVIWKNLVEHFESKSAFNVSHLQNQLAQLKLTDKEDPVQAVRATGTAWQETGRRCMACMHGNAYLASKALHAPSDVSNDTAGTRRPEYETAE